MQQGSAPSAAPMKLHILAFGAHPDDTDIGCSGTLALHAKRGLPVGVCDLTLAELSSNGTVITRAKEAEVAKQALGLSMRVSLQMPDRGLQVSAASVAAVVEVIRTYRPHFIFAPDWQDRHPDHQNCAAIVEEAVFSAGLVRYGSNRGAQPHRVKQIFYYAINGMRSPDIAFDISTSMAQKKAALAAYGSQFDASQGANATPLNQGFVDAIVGRDALVGHQCNIQLAEGFFIKRPYLVPHLAVE